ncbi:MAG: DUF3501 family protein [Nitrospirota bacterium]
MEPIRRADIKPLPEYEPVRDASRREVIALKKLRRVVLGESVSLVFENRRTVMHQIQEMMRAEHIYDEALILHEIETYNKLIPGAGELSATLFIEVDDPQAIKPTLDRLRGLDDGRALVLRIDGVPPICAAFEAGHSNEEKISAVHYVRFHLDGPAQRALRDGSRASLAIVHPRYQAETPLSDDTRRQLLSDL